MLTFNHLFFVRVCTGILHVIVYHLLFILLLISRITSEWIRATIKIIEPYIHHLKNEQPLLFVIIAGISPKIIEISTNSIDASLLTQ